MRWLALAAVLAAAPALGQVAGSAAFFPSSTSSVGPTGTSTQPLTAPGVTLTGAGGITLPDQAWIAGDGGGSVYIVPVDGGTVTVQGEVIANASGTTNANAFNANGGQICLEGNNTFCLLKTGSALGTDQSFGSAQFFLNQVSPWSGSAPFKVTGNGLSNYGMYVDFSLANYFWLNGAPSGSDPFIEALGSDTNIPIDLIPKGTGAVNIGTAATLSLSGGATPTIGTDGGTLTLAVAAGVITGVGGTPIKLTVATATNSATISGVALTATATPCARVTGVALTGVYVPAATTGCACSASNPASQASNVTTSCWPDGAGTVSVQVCTDAVNETTATGYYGCKCDCW